MSWLKENAKADDKGYDVTSEPQNSRLIVGLAHGTQPGSLTLNAPDGRAGLFNIHPIQTRARAGG